ncbi:hypothetical protein [Nonlabens dokdonensis]|uniref:hypothetical protein n=1 Tax=Nonlabens dokdonensis TaxID=328515 RepID=UPI00267908AC|nr:hypothetical protein [Nonlabens dokdonensis]
MGALEYYRNRENLVSIEGIEVDAGSLWKKEPDSKDLVLMDDDQYVTTPLTSKFDAAL